MVKRGGEKIFTHCSLSQAPVWKMHGDISQEHNYLHGSQDWSNACKPPWHKHSGCTNSTTQLNTAELSGKKRRQARREVKRKDTYMLQQTQGKGMCECVPNNLWLCHLPNHHHNHHINVEHRPHCIHTHSAAENWDCKHPRALWFTCRAHNFHHSQ